MALLYAALAVAAGAALGALLRWSLGIGLNHLFPALPPGTLLANLIGGYGVGVAVALFTVHAEVPQEWRLFVITGVLGGLTTFSTFSAESVALLQQGRPGLALGHVSLHLGGSLLMTFAGFASVQAWRS